EPPSAKTVFKLMKIAAFVGPMTPIDALYNIWPTAVPKSALATNAIQKDEGAASNVRHSPGSCNHPTGSMTTLPMSNMYPVRRRGSNDGATLAMMRNEMTCVKMEMKMN